MNTMPRTFDPQLTAAQRAGSESANDGRALRNLSALQLGLGWFPEQPGGLDRFYYELLQALPECGVECRGLLVGTDAAASATAGRVQAFATRAQSLLGRCRAARAAVRASLESHRFDLLVSHFALYAFPSLGLTVDLPFVSHFQGPWSAESRMEGGNRLACWGKARVERAVYRRADRVICLSSAFGKIVERDYDVPRERIRVIPGGIDTDRFDIPETRAQARERLGWPTGRPIVLCVRRLVRRMGLENLVEAASILRREVPDVLFYIAGRGPMMAELEMKVAGGGLQNTCKLLGFVPDQDLPLAYRGADLTVVPSLALEGFGLVAAESLAAGTPAMVTAVGGLPEIVRPLCPELVVPAVSAAQLADSLREALLGRMPIPSGTACAAYARSQFRWPLVASRVRSVYDEACGSGALRGNAT